MSLSRSSYTFFKYKITKKKNHDLRNCKINNLETGGKKHTVANKEWNIRETKAFLDLWSNSIKFSTSNLQGTDMILSPLSGYPEF